MQGYVSDVVFIVMLGMVAISAIAVYMSPRVQELNLKEMRLVLAKIEKVKAEIDAMYGAIDSLERAPMITDNEWQRRLGGGAFVVTAGTVMNYVSGCIKRERERLAQVFVLDNSPEKTAKAIIDHTKDDLVFKWEPGGVPLDSPPRPMEYRRGESHR
ncbi:MAG: hypothetical protein KF859_10505 [Phycisphaeraceae bacterium]|nr:hypothetical protein [Phycisphaeraceae bacterium]